MAATPHITAQNACLNFSDVDPEPVGSAFNWIQKKKVHFNQQIFVEKYNVHVWT